MFCSANSPLTQGPLDTRRAGRREKQEHLNTAEFTPSARAFSIWEGNKTKATDISGNEVTVLPDVIINNSKKKQVLFWDDVQQRADRRIRVFGNRCTPLELILYQFTHVCASADYIQEPGGVETRRINVACVCVLSRKSWETIINRLLLQTCQHWPYDIKLIFLFVMVDIFINDNFWHKDNKYDVSYFFLS